MNITDIRIFNQFVKNIKVCTLYIVKMCSYPLAICLGITHFFGDFFIWIKLNIKLSLKIIKVQ